MRITVCENCPAGNRAVPLNIRCSRKCASPDLPGVSSAEPTLYQIMWVTTGARWSGMTTTWRPFGRVKSVILGAPAATGVMAPAAFATRASAASVVRVLRKALVLPNDDARIVAGGLAKAPSRGEGGAHPRRCAAASQPPSASIARRAVFDSHRFGLLILRADPVGLVRRRRLIARRRRRQVFPHRFAVELAGLPLVAERRKNVLEEALAAELGGPHRPSRFFGRGRSADRPGGLAFVELVARQRTAFRLHGLGGG